VIQISIHHMFRFKAIKLFRSDKKSLFQYIICFGSRMYLLQQMKIQVNFNTSYVSVQVIFDSVSDIKYANFNTSYVSVQVILYPNILNFIIISIHHMFRFKSKELSRKSLQKKYFNTSYVSVQECRKKT